MGKTIDDAFQEFKDVYKKPNKNKFRFLKNHLMFLSYSFSLENRKNYKNNKFQTYKHGSVVKVDFGVNVGDEFSLSHFALVLTKHDNPENACLTVVPLSSQIRSGGVVLGQALFNAINNGFIRYSKLFEMFISYIHLSILFTSTPFSESIKYQLEHIVTEFQKNGIEHKDVYDFMMKIMNEKRGDNETLELSINEMMEILKHEYDRMICELRNFQKFDKNTFAVVSKINTISKYRVEKPSSIYDPLGSITISDLELQAIKEEILKQYI